MVRASLSSPVVQQSHARRWLLGAGGGLLLLLALDTGLRQWNQAQQRVAVLLEQIRQANEPIAVADLSRFYRLPAGEADTTPLWLAALATLRSGTADLSIDVSERLPFFGTGDFPPAPGAAWKNRHVAQTFLADQAVILAQLHAAAAAHGAARFPFEAGPGKIDPRRYLTSLLGAVQVLLLEAHVRLHEGNGPAATTAWLAALAAGRALEREPLTESLQARITFDDIIAGELTRILAVAAFSDADLERLQSTVAGIDYRRQLQQALLGERVKGVQFFQDPTAAARSRGEGFLLELSAKESFQRFLESSAAALAASRLSWPIALQQARSLDQAIRSDRGLSLMAAQSKQWLPGTLFEETAVATAKIHCLQAVLAVERARRQNQTLPASIDAVVPRLLASVPLDPFTSGPLIYRVQRNDYTVYSVGIDGADDGGLDQASGPGHSDVILRVDLPAAAHESATK